ncbi:MAG: RiPP maturation radical SAM C-methyltransferase [Deltaproteobacteria bacterium]|nr:RiPP maturation radical SAM C-methyltransferase [Deltaproteobacteria bacterium]
MTTPVQPRDIFRVALISMPWSIFNRPSIQLGALKAWLDRDSTIQTHTFHPYLQVARVLGTETYHHLARNSWAGEALYSPLLFPGQRLQAARLFNESCRGNKELRGLDFDQTVQLLDLSLDRWLADLDLASFHLIGFSICFNQLLSSLTAAARIKKLHPTVPIVAGGSGCVGQIGASLLHNFPQFDYVISGEGEESLAHLCHCLRQNDAPETLPPQIILRSRPFVDSPCRGIADLNILPTPDYSPYFQEMKETFPGQPFIPILPLEFSRGCWWNRCTFCNLNLQWQGYRWKQSDRVTAEVTEQARRHSCLDFTFTDNALPPKETDLFFQTMAADKIDYDFFAEIRVITDGDKLAAYRRGGLSSVQVGIEALSTTLLARMEKGTTVMDNIAAMKQSRACTMQLDGNLITEFPGSTAEEVAETLVNLDFVLPFTPLSAASFFLGNGSPICNNPKKFGISAVVQHPKNRRIFPREILAGMDMLIMEPRGNRALQRRLWRPVTLKIARWQAFHAGRDIHGIPPLSYRDGGSFLIIRQEQSDGPCLQHRLRGSSREIYLYCHKIRDRKDVARQFPAIHPQALHDFLANLTAKHILFQEGDRILALAIPASAP